MPRHLFTFPAGLKQLTSRYRSTVDPPANLFKRDETTEAEIALMMNVVKQVRSLRGEYKLTNKQKTKTFLEVKNEEAKKVLDSYSDFIRVLTNAEEIGFTKDIPAGCVLTVVNDDVNAHVLLKVFIVLNLDTNHVSRE